MAVSRQQKQASGSKTVRGARGKGLDGFQPKRKSVRALCEAAGKAVTENSEKISQLLLDRTLEGDLASAEFLLVLANLGLEQGKVEQEVQSLARQLEAEPEWSGEGAEGAGELVGRNRE